MTSQLNAAIASTDPATARRLAQMLLTAAEMARSDRVPACFLYAGLSRAVGEPAGGDGVHPLLRGAFLAASEARVTVAPEVALELRAAADSGGPDAGLLRALIAEMATAAREVSADLGSANDEIENVDEIVAGWSE